MKRHFALIVLIVIITAALSVAAVIIVKKSFSQKREDVVSDELRDEFSRAKLFIVDWYNETKQSNGKCSVYLNELSFGNGKTLTFANQRLRATYPRGERYFKLELIKKVEFFEIDGILRGRFSYGENGEYMFKIG